MPEIIVFFIGLVAAVRGAEWLGSASIKLARNWGISQFVIGATLVSIATTLPELSVSVISGIFEKNPQIAIGAVIGSPLANLGICLGLYFIFAQHRPSIGFYSRSVNIFLLISFLIFIYSFYQPFGGPFSLLLILLGVGFIILEFIINKRSIGLPEKIQSRFESFLNIFSSSKNRVILLEFFLGAVLLGIGSKYLIDATLALATSLKLSDLFISVTLLAIGTSTPELINTINSIVHKRDGIAIGNLVGASVIDVTLGLGLGTLITSSRLAFPTNIYILLPLLLISIICLSVLWRKLPVAWVGAALIFTAATAFIFFSLDQIL